MQGNELTLIWAELASGQRVSLKLDLTCAKAGEHAASPSRAYFENQERDAAIAEGLSIKIKP